MELENVILANISYNIKLINITPGPVVGTAISKRAKTDFYFLEWHAMSGCHQFGRTHAVPASQTLEFGEAIAFQHSVIYHTANQHVGPLVFPIALKLKVVKKKKKETIRDLTTTSIDLHTLVSKFFLDTRSRVFVNEMSLPFVVGGKAKVVPHLNVIITSIVEGYKRARDCFTFDSVKKTWRRSHDNHHYNMGGIPDLNSLVSYTNSVSDSSSSSSEDGVKDKNTNIASSTNSQKKISGQLGSGADAKQVSSRHNTSANPRRKESKDRFSRVVINSGPQNNTNASNRSNQMLNSAPTKKSEEPGDDKPGSVISQPFNVKGLPLSAYNLVPVSQRQEQLQQQQQQQKELLEQQKQMRAMTASAFSPRDLTKPQVSIEYSQQPPTPTATNVTHSNGVQPATPNFIEEEGGSSSSEENTFLRDFHATQSMAKMELQPSSPRSKTRDKKSRKDKKEDTHDVKTRKVASDSRADRRRSASAPPKRLTHENSEPKLRTGNEKPSSDRERSRNKSGSGKRRHHDKKKEKASKKANASSSSSSSSSDSVDGEKHAKPAQPSPIPPPEVSVQASVNAANANVNRGTAGKKALPLPPVSPRRFDPSMVRQATGGQPQATAHVQPVVVNSPPTPVQPAVTDDSWIVNVGDENGDDLDAILAETKFYSLEDTISDFSLTLRSERESTLAFDPSFTLSTQSPRAISPRLLEERENTAKEHHNPMHIGSFDLALAQLALDSLTPNTQPSPTVPRDQFDEHSPRSLSPRSGGVRARADLSPGRQPASRSPPSLSPTRLSPRSRKEAEDRPSSSKKPSQPSPQVHQLPFQYHQSTKNQSQQNVHPPQQLQQVQQFHSEERDSTSNSRTPRRRRSNSFPTVLPSATPTTATANVPAPSVNATVSYGSNPPSRHANNNSNPRTPPSAQSLAHIVVPHKINLTMSSGANVSPVQQKSPTEEQGVAESKWRNFAQSRRIGESNNPSPVSSNGGSERVSSHNLNLSGKVTVSNPSPTSGGLKRVDSSSSHTTDSKSSTLDALNELDTIIMQAEEKKKLAAKSSQQFNSNPRVRGSDSLQANRGLLVQSSPHLSLANPNSKRSVMIDELDDLLLEASKIFYSIEESQGERSDADENNSLSRSVTENQPNNPSSKRQPFSNNHQLHFHTSPSPRSSNASLPPNAGVSGNVGVNASIATAGPVLGVTASNPPPSSNPNSAAKYQLRQRLREHKNAPLSAQFGSGSHASDPRRGWDQEKQKLQLQSNKSATWNQNASETSSKTEIDWDELSEFLERERTRSLLKQQAAESYIAETDDNKDKDLEDLNILLLLTSRNFDRQSLKGSLRASKLKLKKDKTQFDKHLEELEAELLLIESEAEEEGAPSNNTFASANNPSPSQSSTFGGIEYNAALAEQRTIRKTTRQRQIAAKFLLNILEDEEAERESSLSSSSSQRQFENPMYQPTSTRQPSKPNAFVKTNINASSGNVSANASVSLSNHSPPHNYTPPVRPVLRRVNPVPEAVPFQPGPDFRRQRARSRSFG